MNVNNPKFITFYIDDNFEFILTQIYNCYEKMLLKYEFIENNEDKIKNRLFKDYLDNQNIRNELGLNEFLFKTETAFVDENYDEKGYTDIEVIDLIGSKKSTQAYYIIECKRLDGKTSLNNEYVNEGINRFKVEKYPTYNIVNGMLGFIVKNINIFENTKHFKDLNQYSFIDNFEFSYRSNHITKSNKNIILYHLMLDFSGKINKR